ncbi:MAG: DUF4368 domain-containing protein, partial [Eubacteriales bacterium]|nr:DUF4368 domain-containing protein [Eubacteriales bacterium]
NGRLYCEDCGSKLHIKRRANGAKAQYVYYICRQSRANSDGFGNCTPHSIRQEIIEQLVLTDIQRVFALAKDQEVSFVETAGKKAQKDNEKSIRKAKTEYSKAENRIQQLDNIISQIYEDKVSGELSSERFAKMLGKYEQEQTELTVKIDALRPVLEQAEAQTQGIDKFLRMVKRFTEIKELSAEVVSEFIERIEVGETVMVNPRRFSHWADEKRQNIRIVYNYIGAMPQEDEPIIASASGKTAYKG